MAIRRQKMQEIIPIFGYVAAFLTTLSFLPQAIKTIKEKNTEGISLVMYSLFTGGVLMWLVYGIFVKDTPIVVANARASGNNIIIKNKI
jgi:MtN3 and saliva related transmembrane protein